MHFFKIELNWIAKLFSPAEPENAKTWKYQIKILVKKMPNFKNKYQILKMPNFNFN